MQSLVCQASDCMNNLNGQCCANTIQVSNTRQETFCDTYTKDNSFVAVQQDHLHSGSYTHGVADTEFGSEIVDSPNIKCNVSECSYNKSFKCKADGVEIDNPHDTMVCNCKTYRPK